MLNADINDTANHLDTMQIHLAELSDNIDEYQSRNEIPPDNLIGRMKEIIREIRNTQKLLDQKRSEKQSLDDRFDKDITRYRKLTASNQQLRQ
jgi:uncharacterized protein (DUF4213/DUF364 family)